MKEFDIEKCKKYEIAIMPEEDWGEPDEIEAWINPVDEALEGEGQWDGSFGSKFEDLLIEHGWGELQEGLWTCSVDDFDEEELINEAKAQGFELTIFRVNE